MERKVQVTIIGAPMAGCEGQPYNPWRSLAGKAAMQLSKRCGEQVQVAYFDLFEPDCPAILASAQLPLVLMDGDVVTSGGKLSILVIRRRIEAQLEWQS
jgi:hypothetical protein